MASDIYRKGKRKKQRSKRQEPFDPLASPYPNQRAFNRTLRRRSQAMIDPLLQDIGGRQREEESAHGGRVTDLQSWQAKWQDTLNKAFADTQSALNNLIAQNSAGSQGAQETMRAALGSQGAENASLGATIGGAIPDQAARSALGEGVLGPQASDQALARVAASIMAGTGSNLSLAGLGGMEGLRQENLRSQGVLNELGQQRSAIMGRLPDIREQIRATMLEEERARQNQGFSQGLANRQFAFQRRESNRNFGLARQNQQFQQWLAEAGFNLDRFRTEDASRLGWAQLALDEDALQLQRDRLDADIAAGVGDFSEQDAKRWDNAVSFMTGFIEPTPDDRNAKDADNRPGMVNPKRYRRNHSPENLFRGLVGQVRMSKGGALRLMMSSGNDAIRKWATTKLHAMRWYRKHHGTLTPRNPEGTPG